MLLEKSTYFQLAVTAHSSSSHGRYPDVYSAQLAIRTLNKTTWHAAPDQPPITVRAADKVARGGEGEGRARSSGGLVPRACLDPRFLA